MLILTILAQVGGTINVINFSLYYNP